VIQADGDQIHQVFVNIIINAIHSMTEGGRFEISARCKAQDAKFVEIAFSDTGHGIPHEYKDKVFNPFFSTKEKGSGLGLAITQRIIGAHGGWIKVEDAVPSGTVFKIYLPVKQPIKQDDNQ